MENARKKAVAVISKEDLAYLKKLHAATEGVKNMIGDVEIAKQRLLGEYNAAVGEESDFVNQLYAKYGIAAGASFTIDEATGEVSAADAAAEIQAGV